MEQREEIGVSIYPLFTHKETNQATELWRRCPMGQPFTLKGERAKPHEEGSVTIEFVDAGHVLGAAGVILRAEGRTVFYSSHLLYEVEPVADEVAILDQGRVIRQAETEALRGECLRCAHR